ncbi:MAG: energy transducer TonB [Verrucomicrobia bacterium]|nr:energy transducer TonB [Verrucomicrobiota bacterium]
MQQALCWRVALPDATEIGGRSFSAGEARGFHFGAMTRPSSTSSSTGAISTAAPTVTAYVLQDELAHYCLPAAGRDASRKIAWVDSICLVFLAIAIIGLNPPKLVIKKKEPAYDTVPAIVELLPQPAVPEPEAQPDETDSNQEAIESPQIVTIVAADPSAAAFAVPVIGATALAPAHLASAPPAHPMQQRPPPPAPKVTTLSSTGRGGDFPEPPYPELARRRGYQGTVVVYIEVDAQGTITRAELKESCGYSMLDEFSVNWIKKKYVFPAGEIRKHLCPFTFKLN